MSESIQGLRRREKRIARKLGRAAYIETDGDVVAAEALVKERAEQKYGIDPATIMLIIKVVMILWDFWKSRNIKTPAEAFTAEELELVGGEGEVSFGDAEGDDDE